MALRLVVPSNMLGRARASLGAISLQLPIRWRWRDSLFIAQQSTLDGLSSALLFGALAGSGNDRAVQAGPIIRLRACLIFCLLLLTSPSSSSGPS